jgi:outer membrane protein OmpA-like peptidoglycan-associated protein
MYRFIYTFCFLFILNILFAQNKTSFAVEVAAFAESVPNGYFKEVAEIYETVDVNYIYRYYIDVPDREAAEIKKNEIRAIGFINARVIDFIELRKGCSALCQYNSPSKTGKRIKPFTSLISTRNTNAISSTRTTSFTNSTYSTNSAKPTRSTNSNKNLDLNSKNSSKKRKASSYSSKPDLNQNIPFFYPSSSSSASAENFNYIFFDFDASYIRDDAKIELDRLIILMQKNPTYQLEILAHTDARGSQKYNNALSIRRVVSTQNYLTKHGIKEIQIVKKNLGESNPIALNQFETGEDTIVGRQLNRRVEFKILDTSGKVLNVIGKIKY